MSEPRMLVVLDCENLNGKPLENLAQTRRVRAVLEEELGNLDAVQVIVAADAHSAFDIANTFPGKAVRFGFGKDGADLALLAELEDDSLAENFDEIVLVSGDGIFASRIAELAGLGITTRVISLAGQLSRRLQLAAMSHQLIDPIRLVQAPEVSNIIRASFGIAA